MSDVAALLSQLTNGSAQPSTDPALAAIRMARASIDALVLRMGESIEARVVGQLAGGLTQLASGDEAFVLKLPSPLPAGAAVSIRAQPAADGQPAVTVRLSAPLPASTSGNAAAPALPASILAASSAASAPAAVPQRPLAQPAPAAPNDPRPAPAVPSRPDQIPAARPQQAVAQPMTGGTPAAPMSEVAQVVARPTGLPAPAAALQGTTSVVATAAAAATGARATPVATQPAPMAVPAAAGPVAAPTSLSAEAIARPVLPSPILSTGPAPAAPGANGPAVVAVTARSAAVPLPQPGVATLPLPPAMPAGRQAPVPAPAAPLNLADLGQLAARQDSVAPLLARLAGALVQGAALPRPVVEVALRLLAGRLDLNRTPPDGTVLRDAVLASGVLADAARSSSSTRDNLLQLRSGLLAVLGSDAEVAVASVRRAALPLRGEAPRAAAPQGPASPGQALPEIARNLLGHTDAALSRLKLMQVASQPADSTRPDAQSARPEFRVEIPLLLGTETAMLHLQVERDARHRPSRRERAWRMRFAVHFSATGEIGAEVALFGRTANVSVWAAETDTADAIEAMLPELAPALARHGLDVGAVRVRRGAPASRPHHPGRLLDSAR